MKQQNMPRRKSQNRKRTFRISEYQVLIISAVLYVFQNYAFSFNTINFPTWLYISFIIMAIVVNLIVKKKELMETQKVMEFFLVFKSFIVYFFLVFSVGLFAFGIANSLYSQKNALEILDLKIISVFEETSRSSNRVYFEIDNKEYGVGVTSSPIISSMIKNKEVLNRSYILLTCKKGLCGTYLIKDKEIVVR